MAFVQGKLTSHSHRPDAVKRFFARGDLIVVVLMGKSELIQHQQLAPRIFDGLKVCHCSTYSG
jgi:hypothetical protein